MNPTLIVVVQRRIASDSRNDLHAANFHRVGFPIGGITLLTSEPEVLPGPELQSVVHITRRPSVINDIGFKFINHHRCFIYNIIRYTMS